MRQLLILKPVHELIASSLTLDTACSSALYALHLAVLGLRNGDCDAAIVAGSNLISDPGSQMLISKLGALSPTSVCHTFDASADGYARAEGIGALYIMPLNRAVAGSYPIRAVIRGTAINAYVQPVPRSALLISSTAMAALRASHTPV